MLALLPMRGIVCECVSVSVDMRVRNATRNPASLIVDAWLRADTHPHSPALATHSEGRMP